MKRVFRDAGHLLRPLLVLLAGIAIFLALRRAVIPQAFGKFGHYRPAALDSIRARPIHYAGESECLACHDEQATVRSKGKHAHVSCEACHGPQSAHASDPGSVVPQKIEVANLCRFCHEKDSAKPQAFPQVVTAEHSQGVPCDTCHQPHAPKP
jgi:ABC-type nickel/cobalt efflux system permease component RcnA